MRGQLGTRSQQDNQFRLQSSGRDLLTSKKTEGISNTSHNLRDLENCYSILVELMIIEKNKSLPFKNKHKTKNHRY